MVAFAYTARTKSGERASGTIDASDKRQATQLVERMGYVPISVRESSGREAKKESKKEKVASGRKPPPRRRKSQTGAEGEITKGAHGRMSHRATLDFSRELKDLVTSGMTIGQALDSLAKRSGKDKARAGIVSNLYEDITQGQSLSGALKKHPDTFNSFYTSMVSAGEASGQLPDALGNIINHMERIQKAKETVTGALIYPVVLVVLMLGAVIFIMVSVIPKFAVIFKDMDQTLPLFTRILIGTSDFLASWRGAVFGLLLVLFGFMLRAWTKTPPGRRTWHKAQLKTPVLRGIVANNAYAQFARTLGGLMRNGVPVLSAMRITSTACTNVVISDEVARATERVADGAAISGTLEEGGVFPTMLTDMMAVGEQAGDVPKALDYVAERYDNDLQRSIATFTKLIEPILLVVMGGLIAFIAIAMLSAVFQISGSMSK